MERFAGASDVSYGGELPFPELEFWDSPLEAELRLYSVAIVLNILDLNKAEKIYPQNRNYWKLEKTTEIDWRFAKKIKRYEIEREWVYVSIREEVRNEEKDVV